MLQAVNVLLSGGAELLAGALPDDAVTRLADGFGATGRLPGGH